MMTMNILLSDEMTAFVETQSTEDGYASVSEYLRALIREAQKRKAKRELDAKLLDGLKGPVIELTSEVWDGIERKARERFDREQARS